MADVIQFPRKTEPKEEALRALARTIMCHLTVALYDRNILDIPAQAFVDDMCGNLIDDAFDYEPDILRAIGESPEMLLRLEKLFIKTLIDRGYVSPDKA